MYINALEDMMVMAHRYEKKNDNLCRGRIVFNMEYNNIR